MTFAHIFDIGAACALAFFVVRGALRGLTGEILSLLGLIASVFCGWTFAQPTAHFVLTYFPTWNPPIVELACAVVLFMVVSLFFAAIGKIMRALVRAANLSLLDHAAGVVSGLARAFFLILFIYGVVFIFPAIPNAWMKESIAMRAAAVAWPPVYRLLSERGWINLEPLPPTSLFPDPIFPLSDARD